jgi:hypothetical protein
MSLISKRFKLYSWKNFVFLQTWENLDEKYCRFYRKSTQKTMSGIFLGCQESNNMYHKALITHILSVFFIIFKET